MFSIFFFSNFLLIKDLGTGHLNEGCRIITELIVLLIMWGSMPLKVVSTSGNSGTFAQASFSEFVNQLFLQSLLLMPQLSHLEPLLEENDQL